MLSVSVALSSFSNHSLYLLAGLSVSEEIISGRNLHIFTDNAGAEHSTARGYAKLFDHTCVVHSIWLKALELGTGIFVSRVPSKLNLADDPSREDYRLLERMGAVRRKPWIDPRFLQRDAWASLLSASATANAVSV